MSTRQLLYYKHGAKSYVIRDLHACVYVCDTSTPLAPKGPPEMEKPFPEVPGLWESNRKRPVLNPYVLGNWTCGGRVKWPCAPNIWSWEPKAAHEVFQRILPMTMYVMFGSMTMCVYIYISTHIFFIFSHYALLSWCSLHWVDLFCVWFGIYVYVCTCHFLCHH